MKVSDHTNLSHVASLPAEGIIKAAAIIKVTAIEGMTVGLYTTPRGPTPILVADEVILDEDPIPGVLPTLICPGDILAGLNLHPDSIGGTDLILAAEPNPNRDRDLIILGVTTVSEPQTTSARSKTLGHPRRTDNLPSKPSNVEPISKPGSFRQFPRSKWSHLWIRLPKVLF